MSRIAAALLALVLVTAMTATASAAAPPDLWKVGHGPTGSTKTELHIMDGGTNFVSWMLNWPSADGHNQTDSNVEYVSGDFNTDGHTDVWKVGHGPTGSGTTEVHILDGSNRFGGFLLNWPTADGHNQTDSNVEYVTGDFNTDGRTDLWKVAHGPTGSNKTEVHILNGANNFQSFLLNWPSVDAAGMADSNFEYVSGDFNRDGRVDLWKVQHQTSGSNKTEVHVMDGANNFASWLGHPVTVDAAGQSDANVEYLASDYNGDTYVDLWKVKHGSNGSGKTEVSIMDGATNFSSWLLNATTIDGHNQTDSNVEYLAADYKGAGNNGAPGTSCTQSGLVDSFEYDPVPATTCWNSFALVDGNASVTRTTATASHHSSAMQSHLSPASGGTPAGTRAELQCHAVANGCAGSDGSEFVYEYDINVPSGYTPPTRGASIAQTKPSRVIPPAPGDTQEDCYGGGLLMKQVADPARIQLLFDQNWGNILTDSNGFCYTSGKQTHTFPGTFTRDAWHRIKIHVRWSDQSSASSAYLRIWVDGQEVVAPTTQHNLLNSTPNPQDGNDTRYQVFRLGLYSSINTTPLRVYYDNVVVRKLN